MEVIVEQSRTSLIIYSILMIMGTSPEMMRKIPMMMNPKLIARSLFAMKRAPTMIMRIE